MRANKRKGIGIRKNRHLGAGKHQRWRSKTFTTHSRYLKKAYSVKRGAKRRSKSRDSN